MFLVHYLLRNILDVVVGYQPWDEVVQHFLMDHPERVVLVPVVSRLIVHSLKKIRRNFDKVILVFYLRNHRLYLWVKIPLHVGKQWVQLVLGKVIYFLSVYELF